MRKKAIETVSGICLLISGMFIPMKNVEAFDTYTASLAESESDTSDDWYNETKKRLLGDMSDPYGFYYTIPSCEESELYYGSGLGDTLYICIYEEKAIAFLFLCRVYFGMIYMRQMNIL